MLADERLSAVRERCEATLRRNWRTGTRPADGHPFAYTCPSPGHYPWQWYSDSCFTAIVWRHFDPERSRRELESLLAAQLEDGFIGHTIFWDNNPLTGAGMGAVEFGWSTLVMELIATDPRAAQSYLEP